MPSATIAYAIIFVLAAHYSGQAQCTSSSIEETIGDASNGLDAARASTVGQGVSREELSEAEMSPDIQKIIRSYGGHPLGYLLRRFFAAEAVDGPASKSIT